MFSYFLVSRDLQVMWGGLWRHGSFLLSVGKRPHAWIPTVTFLKLTARSQINRESISLNA
jgi:hypothetical protein